MSEIEQIITIPVSDGTLAWARGLGESSDSKVERQIIERLSPVLDALIDSKFVNEDWKWILNPVAGGNGVERTIEVVTVFPGLESDADIKKLTMRLDSSQAVNRF